MAQPPPLECARCDLPALIVVEHPALFRMVIPYCVLHYLLEARHLKLIDIQSPEGQAVLSSSTVLRGYVVPRTVS